MILSTDNVSRLFLVRFKLAGCPWNTFARDALTPPSFAHRLRKAQPAPCNKPVETTNLTQTVHHRDTPTSHHVRIHCRYYV